MSRVRADDYDAKKQDILDQAAALFAGKGFQTTSMIDIARACGASKSNLYHYFSSKEEVLYAITSEHTESMYADLSEVATLPLPAEERFSRFVTSFVRLAADSRNEHLVLMKDMAFLPENKRDELLKLEGKIVEVLIGLLEEINPGVLKQVEVKTPYAMLLFGMLIWTFTWYEKGGSISPEELADRITDLFLYGFKDGTFS
ncbi:TetR/AcrR family transcriptional regulator [Alloalcanivorax mobilis]|uniref:TetR/AcrR family transcriptional regulator n=1 Tax=Alloalcanivorax mobilis TaxID=2019569 RepID=UPI000C768E66|nr:TetR/AcrR family transcriptional regulator [Alloalcanivorax mobilis]|tara:strand:+ start:38845 stop:39447 length:603 start_codon:yes stop_codon:yes gene_type:complete